jgi:hypothetical protein
MTWRQSTVRARELGRRLAAALDEADLSAGQLRAIMRWSPTRWLRVVSGERPISLADTTTILGLCRVDAVARDLALQLCEPHLDAPLSLPREQAWTVYLAEAGTATRFFEFHPCIVPWVVQTPEYTRALITSGNVPAFDADREIAARGELTSLLVEAEVDVVMADWSICTRVGNDEVMSGQLRYLHQLSELPNVTLRVLSSDKRPDITRYSGFAVLDFDDHRSVTYREDYSIGILTDDRHDIAVFESIVDALSTAALNEQKSSDIIGRATIALYSSATT